MRHLRKTLFSFLALIAGAACAVAVSAEEISTGDFSDVYNAAHAAAVEYHQTSTPAAFPLRTETGDFTQLPKYAVSTETQISKLVLDAVNSTQTSLDLALYTFTLSDVSDAIYKAKQRGVAVRVILNTDNFTSHSSPDQAITNLINAGIEVKRLAGGNGGIMHNKIAICDGALVVAGSFNWTKLADSFNYENAVFIKDAGVISAYGKYYEYMWGRAMPLKGEAKASSTPIPVPSTSEYTVRLNNETFPPYVFSPSAGTVQLIVKAIQDARETIDLAMYSFTSDAIGSAIIDAKNRGIKIRYVADLTQGKSSPLSSKFMSAGLEVRTLQGRGTRGMMHNKFVVIDNKMVETGSYNWTQNAEKSNHENSIFTNDSEMVAGFAKYFEEMYQKAKILTSSSLTPSAPVSPEEQRF